MLRTVMLFSAAALIVLLGDAFLGGQVVHAQEYVTGMPGPHQLNRGPGFNLAIWKLVFVLLIVWMWVKTTDWISRDSVEIGKNIGLPPDVWNPIAVFVFFVAFLATLLIPIFLAGYAVLVLAYFIPLFTYILMRNGRVTQEQKVLTPDHIKRTIQNIGRGKKGPVVQKQPWELGPAVDMQSVGPVASVNQANMIEARQSPAFVPAKRLIADGLDNRAEKIMLEFTADAVAVKYYVDGVWHAGNPKIHDKEPFNRQWGDQILEVMKKLAALNPADRRSKQSGKCKIEYSGSKYDTHVDTQGTQTGERAIIWFFLITKHVKSLEDLGMRDKQQAQLKEIMGMGNTGILAFATMPGDGLSCLWVAALRNTDRLLRDFVSIENASAEEPHVENVNLNSFKPEAGESVESTLPKILLKQPEVICVPHIASGAVLSVLVIQAESQNRLGIVSLRGKDAPDTLLRLLALKPDMPNFAQQMKAVIYGRLIRKLCPDCKEPIPLTPELGQRLGIPPGRVENIFRERQPKTPEQLLEMKKKGIPEVCPKCRGLGYFGRTGIFEILVLDDRVKQALIQAPKLDVIKQTAKQAGNRSLQEEGILLIALGITSLTELQRILKQ